ncbi:hypothetical protein XELAEV_18042697mg, partial [Xenopus laevis]
VSYASATPSLSDKTQFPSFLRTIHNIYYECFIVVDLLKYFNWTWVGIIVSDNDLGRASLQIVTREHEKKGGCFALQEILPIFPSIESVLRIVDAVKKSKATVIVLFCTTENLVSLMEQASFHNITDKVWVGTPGWSITSDFPRRDILTTLNGSLGLANQNGKIPGFREFLYSIHPSIFANDPFMKTFWENAFHCVWPGNEAYNNTSPALLKNGTVWCTGKERLDSIDTNIYDVYNFKYTYKVHNAVFAVAHALHQMKNCVPGKGPFKNGSCADIYDHQPWQLLHYLKRVDFKNTAGEQIFFDQNGDVPISVDILNWQLFPNGSNQYVYIGSIDAGAPKGQQFSIQLNKILWNAGHSQVPVSVCSDPCPRGYRKAALQGQKACCFDCLPCSEGEILNPNDNSECFKCPEDKWPNSRKEECLLKPIKFLSYEETLGSSLACISIVFCLLTFSVFCLFIVKQETPIVKANNRELSYLLLISLMFGFLCSLAFIGRPNKLMCMIRQVMFAVIFSLCISAILAKTITVIIIFSATNPNSKINKLGKETVAVEIFAILSSSAGLLVCIFLPKCYIILLHPELNSKEYITRRNARSQQI